MLNVQYNCCLVPVFVIVSIEIVTKPDSLFLVKESAAIEPPGDMASL